MVKRLVALILAGLGMTTLACAVGRGATKAPEVGDPAPPFSLPGSDGKTYRLSDFAGRQAVVLAWFPKAFTSG
jgi:peroxiredoxin Q/BCP